MRPVLPALFLLIPGLVLGAEKLAQKPSAPLGQFLPDPDGEEQSVIPAISLLPDGSILENVMLPRYDSDRKLISVLKSDRMVLLTADRISGETVSMESFNPDRSTKARADLEEVLFDQKKGILTANKPVNIQSDRLTAQGSGLVYHLDANKGFLKGPVTTTIIQAPATAMNPASPALRATALLGASLLPLIAAPPVVTPAELTAIEQSAAPMAGPAAEANKTARNNLRTALEASDAANKAAIEFLDEADLLAAAGTTPADPAPDSKPLEIPKDPQLTTINGDGLYFDAPQNVAVFLKNIVVTDPGFHLTASNDLKIFFDKKPAKPETSASDAAATPDAAKPEKKKNSLSFGGDGGFGDPKSIVASGAVKITQKNVPQGEAPLQASAAHFHYDVKSGVITLSGGNPWFMQGTSGLRAGKATAWIRIDKDYNISSDPTGNWTAFGNLNDAR